MSGGAQRLIDALEKIDAGHIVLLAYHTEWLIESILKSEGRKLNVEWCG